MVLMSHGVVLLLTERGSPFSLMEGLETEPLPLIREFSPNGGYCPFSVFRFTRVAKAATRMVSLPPGIPPKELLTPCGCHSPSPR